MLVLAFASEWGFAKVRLIASEKGWVVASVSLWRFVLTFELVSEWEFAFASESQK